MTRHIEHHIAQLKDSILRFGTIVEESISLSNTALFKQDVVLAQKVMANDAEIDRIEVELEEECLKVLALYQPVAADLRFVVPSVSHNCTIAKVRGLMGNQGPRYHAEMLAMRVKYQYCCSVLYCCELHLI